MTVCTIQSPLPPRSAAILEKEVIGQKNSPSGDALGTSAPPLTADELFQRRGR